MARSLLTDGRTGCLSSSSGISAIWRIGMMVNLPSLEDRIIVGGSIFVVAMKKFGTIFR